METLSVIYTYALLKHIDDYSYDMIRELRTNEEIEQAEKLIKNNNNKYILYIYSGYSDESEKLDAVYVFESIEIARNNYMMAYKSWYDYTSGEYQDMSGKKGILPFKIEELS